LSGWGEAPVALYGACYVVAAGFYVNGFSVNPEEVGYNKVTAIILLSKCK
jgi:hypothetical protein